MAESVIRLMTNEAAEEMGDDSQLAVKRLRGSTGTDWKRSYPHYRSNFT